MIFTHYNKNDLALYKLLPQEKLLDGVTPQELDFCPEAQTYEVHFPTSEYSFLHETAVIEYHGVLFASWYNNHGVELSGRTPLRGRKSTDGGKSWSEVETYADDATGRIKYCPPVYGICDDKLYMLVNEMYIKPDHMHALNLYIYDEENDKFKFLWSRPIPFKLNTNVYKLSNGKLMLPGRIAKPDGFPNTPAVLISDSGKIDAEWRLVKIQENGDLPDGSQLEHPELSAITDGENITMFCRDDYRNVPLIYKSADSGESWSGPYSHDIPFSNSKIYSGTLKNGRNYVIGNLYPGRSKLAIFFTKPYEKSFSSGYILQNGKSNLLGYGNTWHYPCAYEANGMLYVIYSADSDKGRGAVITAIPTE